MLLSLLKIKVLKFFLNITKLTLKHLIRINITPMMQKLNTQKNIIMSLFLKERISQLSLKKMSM